MVNRVYPSCSAYINAFDVHFCLQIMLSLRSHLMTLLFRPWILSFLPVFILFTCGASATILSPFFFRVDL